MSTEVIDIEKAFAEDFTQGSSQLAEIMASGTPSVTFDEEIEKFVIRVDETDANEVKDVKRSVEFIVNTAVDMISILKKLAFQTGNARYFETVNSYLNTINNSMNKLIDIRKASGNTSTPGGIENKGTMNVQNNNYTISPGDAPVELVQSSDVFKEASRRRDLERKLINVDFSDDEDE